MRSGEGRGAIVGESCGKVTSKPVRGPSWGSNLGSIVEHFNDSFSIKFAMVFVDALVGPMLIDFGRIRGSSWEHFWYFFGTLKVIDFCNPPMQKLTF